MWLSYVANTNLIVGKHTHIVDVNAISFSAV
jgi:hypothetical protein